MEELNEKLIELIDQRVTKALKENKTQLELFPRKLRYTKQETAEFHSVTTRTIDNWSRDPQIPLDRIEVGGRVFFGGEQVENLEGHV